MTPGDVALTARSSSPWLNLVGSIGISVLQLAVQVVWAEEFHLGPTPNWTCKFPGIQLSLCFLTRLGTGLFPGAGQTEDLHIVQEVGLCEVGKGAYLRVVHRGQVQPGRRPAVERRRFRPLQTRGHTWGVSSSFGEGWPEKGENRPAGGKIGPSVFSRRCRGPNSKSARIPAKTGLKRNRPLDRVQRAVGRERAVGSPTPTGGNGIRTRDLLHAMQALSRTELCPRSWKRRCGRFSKSRRDGAPARSGPSQEGLIVGAAGRPVNGLRTGESGGPRRRGGVV